MPCTTWCLACLTTASARRIGGCSGYCRQDRRTIAPPAPASCRGCGNCGWPAERVAVPRPNGATAASTLPRRMRSSVASAEETRWRKAPMLIVDAQVHIWSAGPPTNPSHRQVNTYSAEECIRDMDAAGVNACLLHPPGWDPNSGKISEEAAAKYPNRFAILGNFPIDKPENRSLIDSWKSRPGMLGLRYAFTQPHQANWMTDGTMDWLWPAAEKAGIPIALMASNYLPLVGQIAERHPGLKL